MKKSNPFPAVPVDAKINARREVVIISEVGPPITVSVEGIEPTLRYKIKDVPERVWGMWKHSQEQMKALGFAVTKVGGKWRMTYRPFNDPIHQLRCREEYRYIDAQFSSGFDVGEVLELCEEVEMPRVDAVVLTHFWMLQNNQIDPFALDCAEAERYFRSDGTLNLAEYIASTGGEYDHPTFL